MTTFLTLILATTNILFTQSSVITEYSECTIEKELVNVVRSNDIEMLKKNIYNTNSSYKVRLLSSIKVMGLESRNTAELRAAIGQIPKNSEQNEAWLQMSDGMCPYASTLDLDRIEKLSHRLNKYFSSIVKTNPDWYKEYFMFGLLTAGNVDSDYAIQAAKLCKTNKSAFLIGLRRLNRDARRDFESEIIDVKKCSPKMLPEEY
jgi:hypothetical protein